jgi:hypothetical protein
MLLPASRGKQNTQRNGNVFYSPGKFLVVFLTLLALV